VSAEQIDRVSGLVETAGKEGAVLRSGGVRAGGELSNGFFFEPTVLSGVTDDMQIAREEIFGPVIPILTYSDPEELATRANDTEFGLAAAVWTNDLNTAHRLAAQIDAGSVYINMPPVPDPAAPWGGFKSSGIGQEMGPYAIESYTKVKGVFIALS
jgi:acyl-CoA reductase-like NAD-dependent aldehyde dehydrogenase